MRAAAMRPVLPSPAIEAARDETPDEPATDLIDLLTDLRHYCDEHGLCFGDCDRVAYVHYAEERHR